MNDKDTIKDTLLHSGIEGYFPHEGMGTFVCSKCGNNTFVSYPQTIPKDASMWTFEFHCKLCGKMMGLTIVDR